MTCLFFNLQPSESLILAMVEQNHNVAEGSMHAIQ
jgi:hypothetical protein